jgi:hypothetical protein
MSFLIKFFMWRDYQPAPFMLELPDYKMPRLRSIAIGVYTRAKMFLQRAGTTIFAMMVLIWFLASFPQPPAGAEGPAINYSLAAIIGEAVAPLLAPVGFNWQIAVALIPGMAAREVAVAALGTVYAIEGGKEAAAQIGQTGARHQMEPCDRAVAAGLVHLCAAMRFHARGDPPRDRKLEVDGVDVRLHAGPRLRGEPCHLQHRGCTRRGLTPEKAPEMILHEMRICRLPIASGCNG